MKVKTYSVNTFDAWLQTEGDDTSGSYVKYEDYAVLAAECAALKSAIEFAEPWLPTCDEELQHRIEMAKQIPATDRIVAEAEARGVEKFAAEQRGAAERLKKRGGDAVTSSIKFCLNSAEEAEDYAKQLREGADK
ncbi:hypothetical protein SK452_004380 [Klebsiella pneumoniae]|uniref:hypothetical protein n=1 Tax=Klebsiella pneumoniae TaxID=573 RepID=UPI000E2C26F4|nr:hypothetical protein [Klebsiella pneumoniae]SWT23861.1 Uncharacterised protein [Klebsiella pneumoniae]